MNLLEEEVIIDELLLGLGGHAVERVEGTGEVTLELAAGLDNLGHDLVTLLLGHTRAERIVSKVATNSDTGGFDESSLLLGEGRAVEARGVHVGDVVVGGGVAVVLLDDAVEEVSEGGVGVLRSSVASDAGVNVLAAREDAHLERNARLVALVVVLGPDVLGEVLGDERLGALGEDREASKIVRVLKVGSTLDALA